jgi:hypothetical protein
LENGEIHDCFMACMSYHSLNECRPGKRTAGDKPHCQEYDCQLLGKSCTGCLIPLEEVKG